MDKKLRFPAVVLVSVTLLATHSMAQYSTVATSVFPFLSLNYSAREAAMAGASVGMPAGLAGFSSNPAVLAYLEKTQVGVAYRTVLMDVWGGFVAAAMPFGQAGVFSINGVDLSDGSVDEYVRGPDGEAAPTGFVWTSNSFAGGVSWAKTIWETLALGVSIKGAYHRMATTGTMNSADGVAVDLGGQYRLLGDRFVTGLAFRNVGFLNSGYSTEADNYPMPFSAAAGFSYVPRYAESLRLALDIEKPADDYASFEPGVEISLLEKVLFIRAGYGFSTKDADYFFGILAGTSESDYQKSQWNSACLGLGLSTANYGFDLDFDAALEFHTNVPPSVLLTAVYSF